MNIQSFLDNSIFLALLLVTIVYWAGAVYSKSRWTHLCLPTGSAWEGQPIKRWESRNQKQRSALVKARPSRTSLS